MAMHSRRFNKRQEEQPQESSGMGMGTTLLVLAVVAGLGYWAYTKYGKGGAAAAVPGGRVKYYYF
jgi:hypothetical protein